MSNHGRAPQRKTEENLKNNRINKKPSEDSQLSVKEHYIEKPVLTNTPFTPRMNEHAAMLSEIPFAVQRQEFITRLHRTYGSRYVQRLVESMNIRAKLTISDTGDVYEKEADSVADTVTESIKSQAQRQLPEEEELQGKLDVSRQAPEEEEELRTQPDAESTATVSDSLETRIDSARGGGHPLPDEVLGLMEKAFGADFSGVRTHTDSDADTLNREISAKAFTTGNDIFFREGEYSPGSDSGKHLLAHELTHVVQQTGAERLHREDEDEADKVPPEAKKKTFWQKIGASLKKIGEVTWEFISEAIVELIDDLGIFSLFSSIKNVISAAHEAYEAWGRQKAYKVKAADEDIGPALMKQIKYGAANSARQFKARVTEFLKESITLINDVISVGLGVFTAGIATLATTCINYCLSGISWIGKQFKKFLNWFKKGDKDRRKRASVIIDAAVEPAADKNDREAAIELITDLKLASPASFTEWWEDEHEAVNAPAKVDDDMLDWIRKNNGETRDKVKAELTESVADTMRGVFW